MKAEAERLRVIVDASEARSAEAEASAAAAGDAVEQHVNLCFLPLVFSQTAQMPQHRLFVLFFHEFRNKNLGFCHNHHKAALHA
jgi:hypothetical protein